MHSHLISLLLLSERAYVRDVVGVAVSVQLPHRPSFSLFLSLSLSLSLSLCLSLILSFSFSSFSFPSNSSLQTAVAAEQARIFLLRLLTVDALQQIGTVSGVWGKLQHFADMLRRYEDGCACRDEC